MVPHFDFIYVQLQPRASLLHTRFFLDISFEKARIDFILLSLNVRGICSRTRRKTVLTWLNNQDSNSTVNTKDVSKKQWRGKF